MLIPARTFKSIKQLSKAIGSSGRVEVTTDMAILLLEHYTRKLYALEGSKPEDLVECMHTGFIIDYLCTQLEEQGNDVSQVIEDIRDKIGLAKHSLVTVFVDGSARNNGDPWKANKSSTAFAVIVDGKVITTQSKYIGNKSSSEAEYLAITAAIDYLTKANLYDRPIVLYCDSESTVSQINMNAVTKHKKLSTLRDNIREKLKIFRDINISHVPSENNRLCDTLAKHASRNTTNKEGN